MAATLQPIVDNSIAKTVNVAETVSREDFRTIYQRAFELGLKGCTLFRPNAIRGKIISEVSATEAVRRCEFTREGENRQAESRSLDDVVLTNHPDG
jgi:ribonucleoside-diphosphate reductase alpha chain